MNRVVTVVVCTRNRPSQIPTAVASLLADPSGSIELIVIDQSDGADTQQALERFLGDPRFIYVRSATRGKSRGLNEAFGLASGSIVVSTDDDCEASLGWVDDMAQALASQPNAAIMFCQVIPVGYDETAGYIPTYYPRQTRLLRSVLSACSGFGLGAGIAMRRDWVISIGGFDECLGVGALFPSAEEWDIALRALLTGRDVYEVKELAILHDGFRSFKEGQRHSRRDWIGIGAWCAKPLRAGHLRAWVVPVWFFCSRAVWPPLSDLLHLRKPSGLIRITAFVEGFVRGLFTRVDRSTLRFIDPRPEHNGPNPRRPLITASPAD
jgi:GT2 family glycosyltransferase